MVNVIVVFPKIEDAKGIRNLLVRNGFHVTAVCTTGAQALNYANSLNDGIVVCGYRFQDMMYEELNACLPEYFDMLLIVSQKYFSEGVEMGVVSLPMPIKTYDLLNTLEMMAEGQARKRRKRRAQPKQRNPEEQKIIEDAKRILMERNHMTEVEAHRYIQKCSMDSGTNMLETAEMVIQIMS
ncbi:MAG: ANTAR domain-containing protein [Lachnospiraceae bacterium]|nr:ANTAR domain-containing protein [Lachnospiraceae bacterium]